ncbi:hypothetical protein PF004_g11062 [Phytophthora fragariae]|uniref:Uncharacterized protein n=1 Tax=Phytophthora fragariae TaxID=53985 RepID=A0A6G0NZ44_9STRA|nr:hypothetical protein PF004_g11062 [Phytophthora fragariae]
MKRPDVFSLSFLKLNERASGMRQDALSWTTMYGDEEPVPFLRERCDQLTAAFNY